MHDLLSNLTAVLLALHTTLGCCWHHAHHCAQPCTAAESVESHAACDDDHWDQTGTAPDSHDREHHGRYACRGSVCVFVSSTRVDLQWQALQFTALPIGLFHGIPSLCDVAVEQPHFAADALLPPVHRHLLCRVLLI